MSKVGPTINGDIIDGMVGSMDSRAMRSRNVLGDDWSDKTAKIFSPEVDHMYASVNEVQSRDREVAQLKKMLQVNLDLIQTQSEALQAKDKEIASLREEINMLRLRNQRMERRVTLKRTKEEPGVSAGVVEPEHLNLNSLPAVCPALEVHVNNTIKKRRASGGSASRRKLRTISAGSDRTKRSVSNSESTDTERKYKPRPEQKTDREYYTGSTEVWTPADLSVSEELTEAQVQVPSWREKTFAPLYTIEGTENVEADVFLKRHQKLECDERRRKRWDIQRIREQTQLERLKQRGEKRRAPNRSPERPVSSFFPSPEDIQEVEVGPELPVLAFGLPLRVCEPSEFSLPWKATCGQKQLIQRHRQKEAF